MTLYRYGPMPALVLGIGGAVLGAAGYFWSTLRPWREMGLFLGILLALGPGLTINGILKPQWSRPRPHQIKDFGGDHEYVSVWHFGPRDASKSFPCGHASMGFFFMGPAFLLYRRRPGWAFSFLLLGLVGGGILGVARVVQGQHFPSDVLWSGGLVYLSGAILSYVFYWLSGMPSSQSGAGRPVILSLDGEESSAAASQVEQPAADRRRAA
jgi:membrane-associated PAP2 superfamily phosphatase